MPQSEAAEAFSQLPATFHVVHYACRHCQQQHVAPHACGNRQPKRKPKAYSLRQVRQLINHCTHPKHRAFLLTVYGAGLRLNEGCHLRPEHIEREPRLIRVEQGKGRKDRYTILPEPVLVTRVAREQGWAPECFVNLGDSGTYGFAPSDFMPSRWDSDLFYRRLLYTSRPWRDFPTTWLAGLFDRVPGGIPRPRADG